MFDNLGDDFPFDWLVKHFQKENIVDIFNHYSRNCLFPTLLFYKRVKIPCRLYVYLANSALVQNSKINYSDGVMEVPAFTLKLILSLSSSKKYSIP